MRNVIKAALIALMLALATPSEAQDFDAGLEAYKDIDHPHRIIFADVIIQMFRKKCALAAVFALNKTLHKNLRQNDDESYHAKRFDTA